MWIRVLVIWHPMTHTTVASFVWAWSTHAMSLRGGLRALWAVLYEEAPLSPVPLFETYSLTGGGEGGLREHCTRASLHSDTVEDLIRISVEGPSLEDARESVASGFSRGQRSRRSNYMSWPSEGHVTAMEEGHKTLSHRDVRLTPLKHLIKILFLFNLSWDVLSLNLSTVKHFKH